MKSFSADSLFPFAAWFLQSLEKLFCSNLKSKESHYHKQGSTRQLLSTVTDEVDENDSSFCKDTLIEHCSTLTHTQVSDYEYYDFSKPHYMQDERRCEAFLQCQTKERSEQEGKKVVVVSSHTNLKPWLVDLQKKSLEYFMKEPYEYLVYGSNLENQKDEDELSAHISNLNLTMRMIPTEIHHDRRCLYPDTLEPFTSNPTTRTTDVMLYMLRDGRNFCSSDYLLILDADCFLVKDFYVSDYLTDHSNLAAVKQGRSFQSLGISVDITYVLNALVLFDLENITHKNAISFDCGRFDMHLLSTNLSLVESGLALDASGRSFEWLMAASPKVNWLQIKGSPDVIQILGIKNGTIIDKLGVSQIFCSGNCTTGQFLHLRDGSGWLTTTSKSGQNSNDNEVMLEGLMNIMERIHVNGQKAEVAKVSPPKHWTTSGTLPPVVLLAATCLPFTLLLVTRLTRAMWMKWKLHSTPKLIKPTSMPL